VLEFAIFGLAPSLLSAVGIGVTLLGVALVAWRRR
jgi:hypothetical protein